MTLPPATALIADDEPLLREALERQLRLVWPELTVVARARNGRESVALFETHRPLVCFLDVHMPGMTGLDAARRIGTRAHLVFVTAFDQYAVRAFDQGALDYLVKPVDAARLAQTVQRLQERVRSAAPAANSNALLEQLLARLERRVPLQWLKASVGDTVTVIAANAVDYLRADDKYTVIAWRDDSGHTREALIRTPLKEIAAQLDAAQFVQIHRAFAVNMRSIARVIRADNDTATVHLKERDELLPVSRNYLKVFKQM